MREARSTSRGGTCAVSWILERKSAESLSMSQRADNASSVYVLYRDAREVHRRVLGMFLISCKIYTFFKKIFERAFGRIVRSVCKTSSRSLNRIRLPVHSCMLPSFVCAPPPQSLYPHYSPFRNLTAYFSIIRSFVKRDSGSVP
jgi:hypothetical protein